MDSSRTVSPKALLGLRSNRIAAQLFWIVSFALFTAIGARLEIPNQPVPYTFQTLAVLLAGGLLGSRNGFISMVIYLGLGIAGLPVFSSGGFGLAKILGPTGGYLLSFPVAALIVGWVVSSPVFSTESRRLMSYFQTLAAMVAGLFVVFALGTMQLNMVYFHNWSLAFQSGFLIFSPWDVLKLVAATTICWEIRRR